MESIQFNAALGNELWARVLADAGQDTYKLRAACERIEAANPGWLHEFHVEWQATLKLIEAKLAANTPTTLLIPAPRPPPTITLDCGPGITGNFESVKVTFGYRMSAGEFIEWGMDYGDGHRYTYDTWADAEAKLYWHSYKTPGTYTATAWIKTGDGQMASDTCVWRWVAPPQVVQTPQPPRTPQVPSEPGGRTGAVCNDGWVSESTGRGTCSHHGGVRYWLYN